MNKIELDTFLKFQFVSNPHFSPDGSAVAFVVTTADREQNTYHGNLYVYRLETKTLFKLTSGGDVKTYAWNSDTTLLFTAGQGRRTSGGSEDSTAFYEISICGAFSEPLSFHDPL